MYIRVRSQILSIANSYGDNLEIRRRSALFSRNLYILPPQCPVATTHYTLVLLVSSPSDLNLNMTAPGCEWFKRPEIDSCQAVVASTRSRNAVPYIAGFTVSIRRHQFAATPAKSRGIGVTPVILTEMLNRKALFESALPL